MSALSELFSPPAECAPTPGYLIAPAEPGTRAHREYLLLRHRSFVVEQGLFPVRDLDDHDASPHTRVLVAVGLGGEVLGGVRLHPACSDAALGWWAGSRLACAPGPARGQVGAALVRAACAVSLAVGALRFDATVQERHVRFFQRLGWEAVGTASIAGRVHRLMRWDGGRVAALVARTKSELGGLVGPMLAPGAFLGDDGAPVPGSDLVACTDAILPSMVERDPEWAGWCAMLVTAHDLGAMGAAPVGALDALGAVDRAHAARVVGGLRAGADAFALPILGGHTQLAVAGALSVTGLGRTCSPVPAGGGRPGDALTVTADLQGGWRPGYGRTQWDSSTRRSREELAAMLGAVAVGRPRAAKDVSMAGVLGTVGMLAEACGCGAEVEIARICRPAGVAAGDWLTCFPGFALVSADAPAAPPPSAGEAVGARCGQLCVEPGVRVRWPDGACTTVLADSVVTGLGPAHDPQSPCPS
ncbi:MAG TPA: MSMEG_0567/sll0787 family protein [Solirubrobacteraceae bacterium]|jgi:putative N-acetyltransferase (TIGR04045 family)|nr:MSMEG_0567/sll0787 family protein [Solirubrobacteraceae bacterium]